MKLVLADDDDFTRGLLARTLEARTAHRITAVADGHLALELALSDDPPDALLLDWMMPTMTGTEVCRRVRAAPLERQPYISLVTAKNQRDELVDGLGVGADDNRTTSRTCWSTGAECCSAPPRSPSTKPSARSIERKNE